VQIGACGPLATIAADRLCLCVMKTKSDSGARKRAQKGLHYGLVGNGVSALTGIIGAIAVRALSHGHFPVQGDVWMVPNVLVGAAFISYWYVACEKRNPPLYRAVSAIVAICVVLTMLRHSGSDWFRPMSAVFWFAGALKPAIDWIPKVLSASPDRTTESIYRYRPLQAYRRKGHATTLRRAVSRDCHLVLAIRGGISLWG
jgi:hypothetical protein